MTDPIADLWVQQHRNAAAPDRDALAQTSVRLRRRVRRRDLTEYVAGLLAAAIFVHLAIYAQDWGVRVGCAAIVLGTSATLFNLWRRRPHGPENYEAAGVDYHRAQLVHQRDVLASVWRWYLAPVVPGMMILVVAIGRTAGQHMSTGAAVLAMSTAVLPVVAVLWGIHKLNRAAARRLQKTIDALDRGEVN